MKTDKKVIAIDLMGGDFSPVSVVDGLCAAETENLHFILCGNFQKVEHLLHKLEEAKISFEFKHSDAVVTSEMSVIQGIRMGKNSSMGMAIDCVSDGSADAVISCGNTGAYMAMSKIAIKMITGIDRPAIASVLPGLNNPTVMLDLGANVESTVRNYIEFAVMGNVLACALLKTQNPKVAILNVGSEDIKGHNLVRDASKILREFLKNYVGFVEGNDITTGNVDVIVTDGFTGNIALKTAEGVASFVSKKIKEAIGSTLIGKIGGFFAGPSIKKGFKMLDPRYYNGAILVGLNGVVVKGHGNSDAFGFARAVSFTELILQNNTLHTIKSQLEASKSWLEFGVSQEMWK